MAARRTTDPASYPVRAKPLPRKAIWADQIFDHIPAVGSDPKSGEQLAKDSNLTVVQVREAVAYLRDNFPDFPLCSSPDGYYFTMDLDAVNKFRRQRVKTALTQIRRTWDGAVKPYLNHINNPFLSQTIHKQYKRIMEDLAELTR